MFSRRLFLSLVATPAFAQKKLLVGVSFSILADVLKEITAGEVDFFTLIGAETEAHHYAPRPSEITKLKQADFLILNGLGFEQGLEKLHPRLIMASKRVTPLPNDPHAFLSLKNMALYVDEIAAHLPCPFAASYKERLVALEAKIKADFAKIPREKRKIVTSHEAFGYFGAEYGIDFIAPMGKLAGEPSAKALANVITQIKRENIKALFVENLTSRKAIETISRETGVTIGGTLYAESLAKQGEASSYLGLMAYNSRLMQAALA